MGCELIFHKAVALAFSNGWHLRTTEPWIAVGVFGPFLFVKYFAIGNSFSCDLTVLSVCFPPFKCFSTGHSSYGFVTKLTAVLHTGFLASYHSFHTIVYLCFNKRSKPDRSLFRSENVTSLVRSVYAKATETVISREASSASSPELILILSYITSEARIWNLSYFVNLSTASERFRILSWYMTGRWSDSRTSGPLTCDGRTFWWTKISSTSPFPIGGEWVGYCGAEI
jgi:hypothetical protein